MRSCRIERGNGIPVEVLKKLTAAIISLFSLIPLGQPLVVGTSSLLASSALMLVVTKEAKSEDAKYYFIRGVEKYSAGNYSGAIADFTKAIEINPTLSKL